MLQSWLPTYQQRVNNAISRYFANNYSSSIVGEELDFVYALRHAVEGGGKRLRPILAMIAYEEISGKECSENIIDGFIGIEFMHCYTLVHDDLPCMDNDILRRGKPTVWKQYGETLAVLVGDALQTMAFERLATLGNIDIVRELASALGSQGVVLGQVRDTLGDQVSSTIDDIMQLHDEKTGGFIASCLAIGGLVAGANATHIEKLREYGILLGRAFQVRDDILDYEGDSSILGKTVGKDREQQKGLVALIGLGKTKKILENISKDLDICLVSWNNEKFREVKEYVVTRES